MTSNPTSPLDKLHDVITPSSVSWWPLSPLAFALIAFCIGLLVLIIFMILKSRKFKQAKVEAIKQSKSLLQVNIENVHALHLLLKRLMKHYYSVQAANQTGREWSKLVSATSAISLSETDLIDLYRQHKGDDLAQLHAKLHKAIATFKVKGAINV